MEALQAGTALAVFLSIWGNMGPTIVLKLDGMLETPLSIRVGYVLPLLSSATGSVFLAHMAEQELAEALTREAALRPEGQPDLDALGARVGSEEGRVGKG